MAIRVGWKLCVTGIVIWLGWPWPRVQGWFTGSSQSVPPSKSCKWYNVTFQELEIHYLSEPLHDSTMIQLMAYPHYESLWVAIDTVGIYPLSVTVNSAAPSQGRVQVDVCPLYDIEGGARDYKWPVHKRVFTRNHMQTEGLHEEFEGNKNITYTVKYLIECIE